MKYYKTLNWNRIQTLEITRIKGNRHYYISDAKYGKKNGNRETYFDIEGKTYDEAIYHKTYDEAKTHLTKQIQERIKEFSSKIEKGLILINSL